MSDVSSATQMVGTALVASMIASLVPRTTEKQLEVVRNAALKFLVLHLEMEYIERMQEQEFLYYTHVLLNIMSAAVDGAKYPENEYCTHLLKHLNGADSTLRILPFNIEPIKVQFVRCMANLTHNRNANLEELSRTCDTLAYDMCLTILEHMYINQRIRLPSR